MTMTATGRKIDAAVRRILEQYYENDLPWYLGFSGGKDSTALIAAVYSALLSIRRPTKPVTLLYCDTGVEIPVIAEYVRMTLVDINKQAKRDGVPVGTKIVRPRLKDSFFVKVIGCGYPPPTNKFRWCTDRLRIGPVRRIMQSSAKAHSIMLLGLRWEESQERARTLERFRLASNFTFKQAGNANTKIFAPLADFSLKHIWDYLHGDDIPKCLNIPTLVRLYKSANGNNCSGQCSNCDYCTSGRFGCWVCTVVRKDRAMTNMVNDGYPELAPLLDFRNWMMRIRDKPYLRYKRRRNGDVGLGPFTARTQRMILSRLKKTEQSTKWQLLSSVEEKCIRRCWEIYASKT
jgi:DNA sulfur modification protein DndC